MIVYIDENTSPHLATALDALEQREPPDRRITVKSLQQEFGKGIKDPDLIPELGKRNAIWITRDKKILKVRIELDLILQNNVGIIILRPGKKAGFWDMVKLVICAWPEIRSLHTNKKPFAYRLHENGKLEKVERIA